MTIDRDRLEESIRRNRTVLNRLESHLGCVVCRGPLTNGRCPVCDACTCEPGRIGLCGACMAALRERETK